MTNVLKTIENNSNESKPNKNKRIDINEIKQNWIEILKKRQRMHAHACSKWSDKQQFRQKKWISVKTPQKNVHFFFCVNKESLHCVFFVCHDRSKC